jgi:hypothetical protein
MRSSNWSWLGTGWRLPSRENDTPASRPPEASADTDSSRSLDRRANDPKSSPSRTEIDGGFAPQQVIAWHERRSRKQSFAAQDGHLV